MGTFVPPPLSSDQGVTTLPSEQFTPPPLSSHQGVTTLPSEMLDEWWQHANPFSGALSAVKNFADDAGGAIENHLTGMAKEFGAANKSARAGNYGDAVTHAWNGFMGGYPLKMDPIPYHDAITKAANKDWNGALMDLSGEASRNLFNIGLARAGTSETVRNIPQTVSNAAEAMPPVVKGAIRGGLAQKGNAAAGAFIGNLVAGHPGAMIGGAIPTTYGVVQGIRQALSEAGPVVVEAAPYDYSSAAAEATVRGRGAPPPPPPATPPPAAAPPEPPPKTPPAAPAAAAAPAPAAPAGYPVVTGNTSGGLKLRPEVPMLDSTVEAYRHFGVPHEVLPGIREIPINAIPDTGGTLSRGLQGRQELQSQIRQSGEINPALIQIHQDGTLSVLDGANRVDALRHMGADSFPAKIILRKAEAPTPEEMASVFKPDEKAMSAAQARYEAAKAAFKAKATAKSGAWANEMADRIYANGQGINPLDSQRLTTDQLDQIAADTTGGRPKLPPASKMSADNILRMRQRIWDLANAGKPFYAAPPGYNPFRPIGRP